MHAAALVLRDQTMPGSEDASTGYTHLRTASFPGMLRLDRAVTGGIVGSGYGVQQNTSTQWSINGSTAFNQTQIAYRAMGNASVSPALQQWVEGSGGGTITNSQGWLGANAGASGQLISTRTEPWGWQIAFGGSSKDSMQYPTNGRNDVVVVSYPTTFDASEGQVVNAKVGTDIAVNVWNNATSQSVVATNVTSAATLSSFVVGTNTVVQVVGRQQEAWREADQLLTSARKHATLGDLRLAYRDALRGLDILLRCASWWRVGIELEEMSSSKYPASFGIGAMRFASGAAKSIPNWTSILRALAATAQAQNLNVRKAMRGLIETDGTS